MQGAPEVTRISLYGRSPTSFSPLRRPILSAKLFLSIVFRLYTLSGNKVTLINCGHVRFTNPKRQTVPLQTEKFDRNLKELLHMLSSVSLVFLNVPIVPLGWLKRSTDRVIGWKHQGCQKTGRS